MKDKRINFKTRYAATLGKVLLAFVALLAVAVFSDVASTHLALFAELPSWLIASGSGIVGVAAFPIIGKMEDEDEDEDKEDEDEDEEDKEDEEEEEEDKSFKFSPRSDFSKYLRHLGKSENSFNKLSAEKQAHIFNRYNNGIRKALAKAIETKATKADIEELKNTLLNVQAEQVKSLNATLKAQGITIAKIQRGTLGDASQKTMQEQLREALTLNIDKLRAMKTGGSSEAKANGFEFTIKAPTTMTGANVSGGNVPVEDRIEGLNVIATRRIRLLDIMSPRATTSNIVSWVYQANKDGAAGQTGEGLAKNQLDFDLIVASEQVKKTTAFIKVSTEMLDDIEWIQSEIQNELMRELLKAVEKGVYDGDGNSNNLRGVYTTATAFAAGAFAGEIDSANEVDVLVVADNQIKIAEQDRANYILMHPTDVTKFKMMKVSSTDRRYVERVMQVGSTLFMDGIPIIETTLVTQGTFLIGNFNLAVLVQKDGIKMDIGLDADDFTKNLRTILAEWRGLALVKNNDRTAFVKGTFSTAIAAITKS